MTAPSSRLALLEQESPAAARLAEFASLAVRVDAGLLRRLRLALLPEEGAEVESDLWFSPIVESRGASGFQIAPSVLDVLRQRLASAPEHVRRRVRTIVDEAHASVSPAIRLEERVNGLAVECGLAAKVAIEDELRKALVAMAREPATAADVARWAIHAASRLHPVARDTAAARALFLAASLVLRLPRPLSSATPSDLPIEELAWALGALTAVSSLDLSVVFVAGGIQFLSASDRTTAIQVPATDPALVQLEWTDEGTVRRELHEVAAGVVVPLHGEPTEITLTTLSGDQYALSGRGEESPRHPERTSSPPVEYFAACRRLARPGDVEACVTAFAVAPDMLITVRARLEGATYLRDANGGAYFVMPGEDQPLVVLRPARVAEQVLSVSEVPLSLSAMRFSVVTSEGAQPAWRDVVVEVGQDRSREPCRALVQTASAHEVRALPGAPVFLGADLVGIVLDVAADPLSSNVCRATLLGVEPLHQVIGEGREKVEQHRTNSARVFVSSTFSAMEPYRDAAVEALLSLGHVPVTSLERTTSTSPPLEEMYSAIDDCDLYVAILGWRYGFVPERPDNPERLSVTELEYRHARRIEKPTLVFAAAAEIDMPDFRDEFDLARSGRFLDAVRSAMFVEEFRSVAELRHDVSNAAAIWSAERASPRSRVRDVPESIGRLIVEIRHSRDGISIRALAGELTSDTQAVVDRQRLDEQLTSTPAAALDATVREKAATLLVRPMMRRLIDAATEVELSLDGESAPYPWELLLAHPEKLSRLGGIALTRSLYITRRVVSPDRALLRVALLLQEDDDVLHATAIRRVLEGAGYRVEHVSRANVGEAMEALARRYFEVVYVAGNLGPPGPGTHEPSGWLRTLTGSIRELRVPPRLVMVNPTHASEWRALEPFAASVARTLISSGVDAVICPGWVTRNTAAVAFAEGFFANARRPFIHAVGEGQSRAARTGHPTHWAAFQCYGHPDFVLISDDPRDQVPPVPPRPTRSRGGKLSTKRSGAKTQKKK